MVRRSQVLREFVADCAERFRIHYHDEVRLPDAVVGKVSSVHLHAYHPYHHAGLDFYDAAPWADLQDWLEVWSGVTGKSMCFTVIVELYSGNVQSDEDRQLVVGELRKLITVDQIGELKVIVIDDEKDFRSAARQLSIDWNRGDANSPQLIQPMIKLEKKCCAWS